MSTQTSYPILDLGALFDLPLFRLHRPAAKPPAEQYPMPCARTRAADIPVPALSAMRPGDEAPERWDGLS